MTAHRGKEAANCIHCCCADSCSNQHALRTVRFRCRSIDWRTLGISNWVGINDYENDRRRTYVLARIS